MTTPQETLEQRLQREAREEVSKQIYDTDGDLVPEDAIASRLLPIIDTIITHTLNEGAEEIGKLKYTGENYGVKVGFNQALTDAQNVLLGNKG